MRKIHGGDVYSFGENMIDFSANITPLGVSEKILSDIKNNLYKIALYPDVECKTLVKAVAEKEKLPKECIVFGNGAAEIIFNAVNAMKPKKVIIAAPAFAEYECAADSVLAEKIFYYMGENNNFDLDEDILECICEDIDLLFLCTPNNPTGRCADIELVLKVVKKCEALGVFVIIDECFMDFVVESERFSFDRYIMEYHNVLIIKSFTKMYAIPGVRLGYGLCGNRDVIDKICLSRQPWNVSVFAQIAGVSALEQKELPEVTRKYVEKEKRFLLENFSEMGIEFFESSANFILFKECEEFDKKLLNYNLIIRNCSNFRGLGKGFFRIAVKSHKENEVLVRALKEIVF